MKVFDLSCEAGHVFEGWFASQDDFDSQRTARNIGCPLCGSMTVDRRPSAPRLNLGAAEPVAAAMLDVQQLQAGFVRAALQIVANTEDVGDRFAVEARRIHYKEAPERGIRGVASRAEAQELVQEGVRIMAFPFPELAKETLQ